MQIQTSVLLDKVVVLGRATRYLERYLNARINDIREGVFKVDKWGSARYPYRYYFHFTDGSFLQVGEGRPGVLPAVRYEFNPVHTQWSSLSGAGQLLANIKFDKFSRLDFAVDYFGQDLSGVRWEDLEHNKGTVDYRAPSGRLETHYLGARASQNQIRVYDKAKESKDYSRGEWWRVESQYRFPDGGDCLGELAFICPFRHIVGYHTGINGQGLRWQERVILERLQVDDSIFGEMDSKTRAKYRKLLDEVSQKLSPQPQDVFEQERFRLIGEIQAMVEVMNTGSVAKKYWEIEKMSNSEENNEKPEKTEEFEVISLNFDFDVE